MSLFRAVDVVELLELAADGGAFFAVVTVGSALLDALPRLEKLGADGVDGVGAENLLLEALRAEN